MVADLQDLYLFEQAPLGEQMLDGSLRVAHEQDAQPSEFHQRHDGRVVDVAVGEG